IVVEDVAEIGRIVAAVGLDHAGGLDHLEDFRIDAGTIEPFPGYVIERPVLHACHPCCRPSARGTHPLLASLWGCVAHCARGMTSRQSIGLSALWTANGDAARNRLNRLDCRAPPASLRPRRCATRAVRVRRRPW